VRLRKFLMGNQERMLMKIWWMLDDSFRYSLHDEYDEIHHIGAIKLSETEWKDYQRVEEEHRAWQERIESLTEGPSGQHSSRVRRLISPHFRGPFSA
jgi:hypothetical protein